MNTQAYQAVSAVVHAFGYLIVSFGIGFYIGRRTR